MRVDTNQSVQVAFALEPAGKNMSTAGTCSALVPLQQTPALCGCLGKLLMQYRILFCCTLGFSSLTTPRVDLPNSEECLSVQACRVERLTCCACGNFPSSTRSWTVRNAVI